MILIVFCIYFNIHWKNCEKMTILLKNKANYTKIW